MLSRPRLNLRLVCQVTPAPSERPVLRHNDSSPGALEIPFRLFESANCSSRSIVARASNGVRTIVIAQQRSLVINDGGNHRQVACGYRLAPNLTRDQHRITVFKSIEQLIRRLVDDPR